MLKIMLLYIVQYNNQNKTKQCDFIMSEFEKNGIKLTKNYFFNER